MAFVKKNFATLGAHATRHVAPQMFSYKSTADNIATVMGAGYFNDVQGLLTTSDTCLVVASDGMHIIRFNAVAANADVTVHAAKITAA